MRHIFNNLSPDNEMPENLKKNEHGVYADVIAKKWWDKEYPSKAQVFVKCKKSVDTFLKNITDDSHGIIPFGKMGL